MGLVVACLERVALVIVPPETVVAWQRRGVRLFWTWKSRRRIGRPSIPPDIRALIRIMSGANPRWGAPRIHGELRKLGMDLSQATVAKYMVRRQQPPSQTWRTFLANPRAQLVAADFFVVPTAAITPSTDGRTPRRRWAWTTSSRRRAPRGRTPYVERFIGSARRECLDHVIVCSATGLQRLMHRYTADYERSRTHLSLDKDAPIPPDRAAQ